MLEDSGPFASSVLCLKSSQQFMLQMYLSIPSMEGTASRNPLFRTEIAASLPSCGRHCRGPRGIELLMATAFHQETNGQIDRTNKTIMQMLRIMETARDRTGRTTSGELSMHTTLGRQHGATNHHHSKWFMADS